MTVRGVLSLTAQIVSAYVGNNVVPTDQLPAMIRDVHRALSTVGQPSTEPAGAGFAVRVKKSILSRHVACLECGAHFKLLKRHLRVAHRITPECYRLRFDLLRTYPLVAPHYAAARSALDLPNRDERHRITDASVIDPSNVRTTKSPQDHCHPVHSPHYRDHSRDRRSRGETQKHQSCIIASNSGGR